MVLAVAAGRRGRGQRRRSAAAAASGARCAAADRFLLGLTLGQIVLLVLFVPGVAAVAVSGEREQNTLEMLYASRLQPGQIIAGKVGVAVGYPLLLLVMALPFVALLNWRGDVRGADLLWAYAILLVTAVFLAVVSLAVSAWSKQSATALVDLVRGRPRALRRRARAGGDHARQRAGHDRAGAALRPRALAGGGGAVAAPAAVELQRRRSRA